MYFLSIFIIPKISGKPSQHQKQICTSVSKILHPSGSESVSKFISQYLLALKTDERLIFVHKTDNFPHSESFSKLNLWARCIFDICDSVFTNQWISGSRVLRVVMSKSVSVSNCYFGGGRNYVSEGKEHEETKPYSTFCAIGLVTLG